MLTRILAVALAAGTLAFATANAQTATPGTGSGSTTTTKPSTSPSTGSMGTGSGSSSTTGNSGMSTGANQAQQPMGAAGFDPTKYKSKTDCLNAASAAKASTSLCNNLK